MINDIDFIPVNTPEISEEDIQAVVTTLRDGWISGEGPIIRRFEETLAEKVGVKHAIAVANGTVALELAIESLNLKPGDEIIMPTLTIISCVTPLISRGLVPIFVDCEIEEFNMLTEEIESLITIRTKAIMVVHLFGLAVNMDRIMNIATKFGIDIIEDASEAHGLAYNNRVIGSFGRISTFSFYANKSITMGEGGAICTNDDELAEICRLKRNLAFMPGKRFIHEEIGWNYRLSSMQAALGTSQLKRIDKLIAHKRQIALKYDEYFLGKPNVKIPPRETDSCQNTYWVYPILLEGDLPDSQTMRDALLSVGVETRPIFYPLHLQPLVTRIYGREKNDFPNAFRMWSRGLYLPSGTGMNLNRVSEVVKRIEPFF
jgi:perosamine synthetase